MRQRVSHFTTKQIEVNQLTRPSPQVVRPAPLKSCRKNLDSRRSLARRIGIQIKVVIGKQKRPSTRQPRPTAQKKGSSKSARERSGLVKESNYAAQPKEKKSELIEEIIRLEAAVFRHLKQHGSTKRIGGFN